MAVCLVLFPQGKGLFTEKPARHCIANIIAFLVLWHTNLAACCNQTEKAAVEL